MPSLTSQSCSDSLPAVCLAGQVGAIDYLYTINTSCITRTNGLKIFKKFNKRAIKRFIFSQRIINDWNSLPRDIVTAPNVLSFKTNLDKFLYNQRFSFV